MNATNRSSSSSSSLEQADDSDFDFEHSGWAHPQVVMTQILQLCGKECISRWELNKIGWQELEAQVSSEKFLHDNHFQDRFRKQLPAYWWFWNVSVKWEWK